jgi:hypothetical protein
LRKAAGPCALTALRSRLGLRLRPPWRTEPPASFRPAAPPRAAPGASGFPPVAPRSSGRGLRPCARAPRPAPAGRGRAREARRRTARPRPHCRHPHRSAASSPRPRHASTPGKQKPGDEPNVSDRPRRGPKPLPPSRREGYREVDRPRGGARSLSLSVSSVYSSAQRDSPHAARCVARGAAAPEAPLRRGMREATRARARPLRATGRLRSPPRRPHPRRRAPRAGRRAWRGLGRDAVRPRPHVSGGRPELPLAMGVSRNAHLPPRRERPVPPPPPSRFSREPRRTRSGGRGLRSTLPATRFGAPSQPTSWRTATTSGPYRTSSATRTRARRCSARTCSVEASAACEAPRTASEAAEKEGVRAPWYGRGVRAQR